MDSLKSIRHQDSNSHQLIINLFTVITLEKCDSDMHDINTKKF